MDKDEHPSAASPEVPPIELKTNDSPGPSPAEPGEDEAAPLRTKPLPKVNAVAREVPVRVTGAKAGSASEERDLFSELTATVMVFEKGGVIRLTAAVTRGQLLFLSNEESKRRMLRRTGIHRAGARVLGYGILRRDGFAAQRRKANRRRRNDCLCGNDR